MSAALPSDFRLIPARAGLNAVAVPQGRNIQAGTAILKSKEEQMMSKLKYLFPILLIASALACSSASVSNSTSNGTSNTAVLNNANLPSGLSAHQVEPSANTTPGIPAPNNVNAAIGTTPIPGIDPKNAMRKIRPGEKIPGIDPDLARRQMSHASNSIGPPPAANANKKP